MNLVPLGDSAVLAYCVSEAEALEFTASSRLASEKWLVDVVQAYTSVALYFDLAQIRYGAVVEWLHERQARSFDAPPRVPARSHRIPCCYEHQLDLDRVALKTGLSAEE